MGHQARRRNKVRNWRAVFAGMTPEQAAAMGAPVADVVRRQRRAVRFAFASAALGLVSLAAAVALVVLR
jgi:hypothetical protein